MSTFLREFESTEALIYVETIEFKTFDVYEKRYAIDDPYYTFPKEKVGSFTNEDLNRIGCNSEKHMSDFISKRYGYTFVYSLNDFREI